MHFLNERMRRLLASGLLPERTGQPVKVLAHISLADLLALDGSSMLQREWTGRVRAQWAAHRAAASVAGGDGGAWLDGNAARAVACDAIVIPVVTGEVDPGVLDDLVRLCVELAGHGRCGGPDQAGPGHDGPGRAAGQPSGPGPDHDAAPDRASHDSPGQGHDAAPDPGDCGTSPRPLTAHARELLERAIIGKTTIFLMHLASGV